MLVGGVGNDARKVVGLRPATFEPGNGDMKPATLANLYTMKIFHRANVYGMHEVHGTMYGRVKYRSNYYMRVMAYTARCGTTAMRCTPD
jgi:hypothetical protein